MADDPVTDQPAANTKEDVTEKETEEVLEQQESGGNVVKSTSWWGVSSLTSYLTSPHLLESGINNVASSVAQVGFLYSFSNFIYRISNISGVKLCCSAIIEGLIIAKFW